MGNVIKATPADAGCWSEGSRGVYGLPHVVRIAQAHGMPLAAEDEEVVTAYESDAYGATVETMDWIADDAERWLDENVAPDGFSFGWFGGEFFLWSEESWDDAFGVEY